MSAKSRARSADPSGAEPLFALLAHWRSRVDPSSVPGLLRGERRRSGSGLTQADIERLTGVSARWYRELEKGRPAKFGPELLEQLATVLKLDEDERRVLYVRATGSVPVSRTVDVDVPAAVDGPVRRLLDKQMPDPAYLADIAGNVLAWNQAELEWFPWLSHERNLVRWTFLHPEAREQLVNWRDDWAGPFLAELRFFCEHHPEDAGLQQLVKDILSGCPDAREIWKACAVREHPDGSVRRLRLPYHGAGEVAVRIMALSPLRGRQFLRLVVLLREDDGAAAGGEGPPADS